MKHAACKLEPALLGALRANHLPAHLSAHLGVCASCRHSHRAASLTLAYAAQVRVSLTLPPPATIWATGQRRAKAEALQHLSRAMLAMRLIGATYLVSVTLWTARLLWRSVPLSAASAFAALSARSVPVGVGLVSVLLLAGAVILLLLGQGLPRSPRSC